MPLAVRTALARALSAAMLAALCSCGLPQRYHAAQDVRAFLQAVQDDDQAAFEAHIDRPALRRELTRQVEQAAAGAGLGAGELERLLGRRGEAIADRMISPGAFRIVWRRSGLSTGGPPPAVELAAAIRMNGPDEACLHDFKSGRCVLTFRNEGGTFKLVGVSAQAAQAAPAGP